MSAAAPTSRQANYALLVLLLAYILSFIDRNAMAVLVGPIRADFDISDFQYSLLHGFAFSMFYIFLGLPIARLADRGSRKSIVTIGVFFWSAMTCLCGAAQSFKMLFVARVGVGIGEAALSPPAYSLLSDFFSREALPRAMAIYTLGITIGGGLAYIVGGAVYQYFLSRGAPALPLLGEMRPWQMTFVVVGLPGFLLVLLLSFMVEPRRVGESLDGLESDSDEPPVPASGYSVAEILRCLQGNWQAYFSLIFGVSLLSILGYGTMAWYPEFLVRNHGMNRAEAGSMFGLIFIVAGSLGTILGGWSVKPLLERGYSDASVRIVMWIAIIWMVPAAIGPMLPSGSLALWAAVPIVLFLNSYFGVCIAAIQLITPNRMRAQVSAGLLFMTNLFGLAMGPSFIAALTDFVFADDLALGKSLTVLPLVVCPLATALLAWGLRYYRAALPAELK
ncbi:MAG: spinster family MFS transporter [Halioglobus sp.]